MTVNLECEVQHPCGFPDNRRIGRADGKSARSPGDSAHPVRRVAWRRVEQGNGRAGDEATCLSLIYGTTSSTAASPRPSIQPWQPTTADLGDLSFVRSPAPLGINARTALDSRRTGERGGGQHPASSRHSRSRRERQQKTVCRRSDCAAECRRRPIAAGQRSPGRATGPL